MNIKPREQQLYVTHIGIRSRACVWKHKRKMCFICVKLRFCCLNCFIGFVSLRYLLEEYRMLLLYLGNFDKYCLQIWFVVMHEICEKITYLVRLKLTTNLYRLIAVLYRFTLYVDKWVTLWSPKSLTFNIHPEQPCELI